MFDFRNDILPLKNILFRLALGITGQEADAEDVVQETMLRVWSRRDQWGEIDSIKAFCLTICRNIALDKMKSAGRGHLSIDETAEVTLRSSARTPEQQAVDHDRVALVRRLMAALPERQRTCMQMRDMEGCSYKEIAQALDIPEAQVKVNIFRARQTVKQQFLKLS